MSGERFPSRYRYEPPIQKIRVYQSWRGILVLFIVGLRVQWMTVSPAPDQRKGEWRDLRASKFASDATTGNLQAT